MMLWVLFKFNTKVPNLEVTFLSVTEMILWVLHRGSKQKSWVWGSHFLAVTVMIVWVLVYGSYIQVPNLGVTLFGGYCDDSMMMTDDGTCQYCMVGPKRSLTLHHPAAKIIIIFIIITNGLHYNHHHHHLCCFYSRGSYFSWGIWIELSPDCRHNWYFHDLVLRIK